MKLDQFLKWNNLASSGGEAKNIIKAANIIKRATPKTKIYLQTILPINTQQYQNKLKKDTGNSFYWLEPDFEINIKTYIAVLSCQN